jgi:hypothetical protein
MIRKKELKESRWNNEGGKVAANRWVKIKEICEVLPNYSSKGKFRQERIARLDKIG